MLTLEYSRTNTRVENVSVQHEHGTTVHAINLNIQIESFMSLNSQEHISNTREFYPVYYKRVNSHPQVLCLWTSPASEWYRTREQICT